MDSSEAVLLEQVKRSLLTFNYYSDTSTQFGYRHPMFEATLAPLVPIGLGFCLRHLREPGGALLSIWILVTLLVGGALTVDAPFWPRLVGVLPAAALAAGLTIDRVWAIVEGSVGPRWRPAASGLAAAAATLLLVLAGRAGWEHYLGAVETFVRPQAQLGRYLGSVPVEMAACSFGGSPRVTVRETAFLAWPRPLMDLEAGPAANFEACPGPPQVWVVDARTETLLPRLQSRWPNGAVVEHRSAEGRPVFTTFEVR